MLTLEKLKVMKPGIFATGMTKDKRLQINIDLLAFNLRWVAVRGGIHDWTIYYHNEDMSEDYVARFGYKCCDSVVVRELVYCDDEAFAMYRF